MARRPIVAGLALLALLLVVALPVVAVDPPGKANKPEKAPKEPITLTGTVVAATDAEGHPSFTLDSDGTTYTLEGGPWWYYGDQHPLKAHVGKSVTIVGGRVAGATEVDVETVDGNPLRTAGKPPWAGGWKVVGQSHPGWSKAKAERFAAKFGDCFPPGKCKQNATEPAAARPDE